MHKGPESEAAERNSSILINYTWTPLAVTCQNGLLCWSRYSNHVITQWTFSFVPSFIMNLVPMCRWVALLLCLHSLYNLLPSEKGYFYCLWPTSILPIPGQWAGKSTAARLKCTSRSMKQTQDTPSAERNKGTPGAALEPPVQLGMAQRWVLPKVLDNCH